MVKHIVCWNLYEKANGKTKQQNAMEIKEKLLDLKNKIPHIQTIEVGINSDKANPDNYDVVLITEFKSFGDLQIYQKHPAHQEFVEFVTPLRGNKVAVDYEIDHEK